MMEEEGRKVGIFSQPLVRFHIVQGHGLEEDEIQRVSRQVVVCYTCHAEIFLDRAGSHGTGCRSCITQRLARGCESRLRGGYTHNIQHY